MEQAQQAVDSIVDGVKKVAVGEKKQKVKKVKSGGDGGADAVSSQKTTDVSLLNLYFERRLTKEIHRDPWR